MKTCSICKRQDVQFMKRGSRCVECEKYYQREYYQRNKQKRIQVAKEHSVARMKQLRDYVVEYLRKNSCVDCGETDILVLQFDHNHDKNHNVAMMLVGQRPVSLRKLIGEIAKCSVRCANCHQRKTAIETGYWKVKYT